MPSVLAFSLNPTMREAEAGISGQRAWSTNSSRTAREGYTNLVLNTLPPPPPPKDISSLN